MTHTARITDEEAVDGRGLGASDKSDRAIASTEAVGSPETLRQIYVRVCRDSGFLLDWTAAVQLAAKVAGRHPLDVWMAMPSICVMQEVAAGTHPAVHLPHYATVRP